MGLFHSSYTQRCLFKNQGDPPSAQQESPADNQFAGSLVLVVDDDPTQRVRARAALEDVGYRVEEASDGPEAIAKCKLISPQLVMLDLLMPTLDGFCVCYELGRLPNTKDIPILLVTGVDDMGWIRRGFALGATDFILKPVLWPALALRVGYILRNHKILEEAKRAIDTAGTPQA